MGRECEIQMQTDMARNAYARRLESSGDPGDMWYTVYRLGDMAQDPAQSIRLLLEAYELQPRRREPLAALVRLRVVSNVHIRLTDLIAYPEDETLRR